MSSTPDETPRPAPQPPGAAPEEADPAGPRRVAPGYRIAAAVGLVHAAFSLYWAFGGQLLMDTLGPRLVAFFEDLTWVLIPVALVKATAALLPGWLARRGWPAARFWRPTVWLGAWALLGWGGLNGAIGVLVLSGIFTPEGGFDRPGLIGHGLLWNPLFVLWGTALVVGLRTDRRPRAVPSAHVEAKPTAPRRPLLGPYSVAREIKQRTYGATDTVWIGIDGLGGSGKTSLASLLATELYGTVISVDDFAHPDVRPWDRERFVREVLEPIGRGERACYAVTSWDRAEPVGRRSVYPGGVILVEGVSATARELPVPWSLTVWVEAPEELRRQRVAARDGEQLADTWEHDWRPSERAYLAAERPDRDADLCVDGAGF